MTACHPRHGRHGWVNRARARLAAFLDWACGPYEEEWIELTDDNGEDISGDLPGLDVQLMGHPFDDWPEPDDGRDVADAIHDAEAAEDGPDVHLPGETAQAVPPRQVHHQAVLLRDGTLLMKTPGEPAAYNPAEIDDTLIEARPEPRAGRSVWAPPQPILPAWVTDILGAPSVDLYMWACQQRRAIAA